MDVASILVLSVGDALKRTIVYVALLGACSCSLKEVKVGDEVGGEVGAMVGVVVEAEVEAEVEAAVEAPEREVEPVYFSIQYLYKMLDASNL